MYSVIIVEDDPMVASINRQYVELEPSFSVKQSFKSGQDALSWLSREEADLIILDYYMPLMTGKEFIDRLHSMGKAPSVIMVTSASDSAIVQDLLSRGVLDYLVKPFERSRFRQALSRFAQTRSCLDGSPELNQAEIDRLLSHMQPSSSSFQTETCQGLKRNHTESDPEFPAKPARRVLFQRADCRTGMPVPHYHPPLRELYAGDGGDYKLRGLSDRRSAFHQIYLLLPCTLVTKTCH